MKRRNLILLLGGASSGAMSVGTGAFSSVEAERGVKVSVVEDDEAYLGLDPVEEITAFGRPTKALEITNAFSTELALEVSIVNSNDVVDEIELPGETEPAEFDIGPGESEPVKVTCDGFGDASFTLEFIGEADGATVEKTKIFDGIPVEPVTDVEFRGNNGAAHVFGDFTDMEVTVNGGEFEKTLTADDGEAVIPRDDGAIERVEIGDADYERESEEPGGDDE